MGRRADASPNMDPPADGTQIRSVAGTDYPPPAFPYSYPQPRAWGVDGDSQGSIVPACDQCRVPMKRRFRKTLLGRIVDIDDAKSRLVPRRPFEIVEQRPDEIAAHVRAGGD